MRMSKTYLKGSLLATTVIAGFAVASNNPDGLESFAERIGIRSTNLLASPLADYEAAFVSNAWVSKALAGLAGLTVVYLLCAAMARFVARRRSA